MSAEDLQFWDCNAAIGRWTIPPPGGPLDAEGLERELHRAGIDGAIVHHGLARDYDAAAGNDALFEELRNWPSLVPCPSLLPPATCELPPLEELLPDLVARGARMVRLYPRSHNFSLSEWCSGPLLSALE